MAPIERRIQPSRKCKKVSSDDIPKHSSQVVPRRSVRATSKPSLASQLKTTSKRLHPGPVAKNIVTKKKPRKALAKHPSSPPKTCIDNSNDDDEALPSLSSCSSRDGNKENVAPAPSVVHPFDTYVGDRTSLFSWLEVEEEDANEYRRGGHCLLDIGEVLDDNETKYRIIRKCGFGNFSIAWLTHSSKTKKFYVVKIFKQSLVTVNAEINILKKITNHDHIVCFHNTFDFKKENSIYNCAVFEPLGGTLLTLLNTANAGLTIPAIKKIAKHVLQGLCHLHDMKLVHTDIKPENILSSVTERSLFLAVKDVFNDLKKFGSKKEPNGMRAKALYGKALTLDRNNIQREINEILQDTPQPSSTEPLSRLQTRESLSDALCYPQTLFKIIDLGNALPTRKRYFAGTFEYRAVENSFQCPLRCNFDVWSVGAVVLELAVDRQAFKSSTLYSGREQENVAHIKAITEVLGSCPLGIYKKCGNFKTLEAYCSSDQNQQRKCGEERLTKLIPTQYYSNNEIKEMVDFLMFLFNFDPAKRPSASQCLQHKWLA